VALSPQYVRDLSIKGEFATLTDGQIQNVIDRVVLLYLSLTPEDLYVPVVGLHTAHLLVKLGAGGGGGGNGPLSSAKVGPLEKKFAVGIVQPSDGLDATTPYGAECLRLLKSRLPAMRTSAP
jgi:hypothetical protein